MGEGLLELIPLLKRPVDFASRSGFANLDKVRGLEETARGWCMRALVLRLTPDERALVERLRVLFEGYEAKDAAGRRGVLAAAAEALMELERRAAEEAHDGPVPDVSQAGDAAASYTDRPAGAGTSAPAPGGSVPSGSRPVAEGPISAMPVQYVRGVGPRVAALLGQKNVKTVEDLFYYFPRKYEDRTSLKPISDLRPGRRETVMGRVLVAGKRLTRRRALYEVVIGDGTGRLSLIWFQYNEPYMRRTYRRGVVLILSGDVTLDPYTGGFQIVHPRPENIEVIPDERSIERDALNFSRIVPVYPLVGNLSQRRLRKVMHGLVTGFAQRIPDPLPEDTRRRHGLLPLDEALRRVHFPEKEDGVVDLDSPASVYASTPHRTVAFLDFLVLELGMAMRKRETASKPGVSVQPTSRLTSRLFERLHFPLTGAQRRVLAEIERDMRSPRPMNRLLQGDVGCGKTVVGVVAMLMAVEGGYQCAFMAPTEVLADQHFSSLRSMVEPLGVSVALLTGGSRSRSRRRTLEGLRRGDVDIVVGTHALLEEDVEFARLGLVVIDEQHKFGVLQRARLARKARCPDVLVMTATPIPRTLALTLYGDLDVSTIDEMPPGRKRVETVVLYEDKGGREEAFRLVRSHLQQGRQAYFVCPMIEEADSDDQRSVRHAAAVAEELQSRRFADRRVGLLHGRMSAAEKEEVMKEFARGAIDVLVSTTVVEVGVDVPNATVMVIENAERFGLAQLHQLRGRVGRGAHRSQCVLLVGPRSTEQARRRLDVLRRTADGFRIAEEDLLMRGPGEFMGTKQAGIPEFRFADIVRDRRILEEARREALRLVEADPTLEGAPLLREEVLRRWGERLSFAAA